MKKKILNQGKKNELHVYDDGRRITVRTKQEEELRQKESDRTFYMVMFVYYTVVIIGLVYFLIKYTSK